MRSYFGILAIMICFPLWSIGQAMGWNVGLFETQDQEMVELSKELGSKYEDTYPVVSLDGRCLLFAKKGHPLNFGVSDQEDIWATFLDDNDHWSKPVNLGTSINSSAKNLPIGISADGRQLYVLVQDDTFGKTSLKAFTKEDRFWRFQQETIINGFDSGERIASASVSPDGKILCFTAPSQKGGQNQDIYIAFRESPTTWSIPFKLPALINSSGDERFVFLAADQQTLYFSSNGLTGMGGYDLYVTRRLNHTWKEWSSPVNLGELINSIEDEVSIAISGSGDRAYYGVENGEQGAKLNYITLPESIRPKPIQLITGHFEMSTATVLDQLDLIDESTGLKLWDEDGNFQLVNRASTVPSVFKMLGNAYPQLIKENTPKLELDNDQYNLLSTAGEERVSYFQREAEIDLLQQRITEYSLAKKAFLYELQTSRGRFKEKVDQMDLWSRVNSGLYLEGIPVLDTLPELEYEQEEKARRQKKFKELYKEKPEPINNEDYLWGKEMSASDFDQVLKQELAPEALLSLKLKLYGEVMAEMEKELPLEALKKLEYQEKDLREQIKQSLAVAKAGYEPSGVAGHQAYTDSLSEHKLVLADHLKKDIIEELEGSLDEEAKAILKAELAYLSYAGVEEDWQKKLDAKVDQQMVEEKEMGIGEKGMVPLSYEYERDQQERLKFEQIDQHYKLVAGVPGMVIQLSGVGFAPNTAELKPRSFQELDLLVDFLNRNSSLKIEVAAHTNSWISHTQSMELTQKRAQVIIKYLSEKGIMNNRLVAKGYGKKRPLVSNETVEGRQLNQRIEMTILENE